MILTLIAAHDPDLVIGYEGGLPWRIPEDLKHFKQRTTGHPLLMGRGTFEELGEKPLPGRTNLVLTRRNYENVDTFDSVEKALEYLRDNEKVYVIGGGQVYTQLIDHADRLEITEIHQRHNGDVYFPEYRDKIGSIWKEVYREDHENFSFIDYDRIA